MSTRTKTRTALLWTLQGLLTALFLFAGISKLLMPSATLAAASTLPVGFLRFIGVCEALGALGLVLPGLFRIRTGLTPLAAVLLAVIMVGATGTTMATLGVSPAMFPFAIGVLLALVAIGRAPAPSSIRHAEPRLA